MIVDLTEEEWTLTMQCLHSFGGPAHHVPDQDKMKILDILEKIKIEFKKNEPVTISRNNVDKLIDILEASLDSGDPDMDRDIKGMLKMLKNENRT